MHSFKKVMFCIGLLTAAVLILPTTFKGAELTADEIMDRVRENRYPETSEALVTMTLREPGGKSFVKKFTMWRKVFGNNAKTLIIFHSPPEVNGTSFLVLQEGDKESTFAKFTENPMVQRISESQRSDRFMGSDFTYGDLRIDRKGEDNYRKLGDETIGGHNCYIIESTPKNIKKAQYTKVVLWVDKDKFVPRKTDFYEKKKGRHVKTLDTKKIEMVENTWTATLSVMTDLKDNHKTTMDLTEIHFRIPLKDEMFTPRTLMRGI